LLDPEALSTYQLGAWAEEGPPPGEWTKYSPMGVPPDQEPGRPWTPRGLLKTKRASWGVFTMKTGGSFPGYFELQEGRLDDGRGYTAEVRLRFLGWPRQDHDGAIFSVQDGAREAKLAFFPDRVQVLDQNELKAEYGVDTGAFHTYRLAAVAGTLNVYVDGRLAASARLSNRVGGRRLLFGDVSSQPGENISVLVDYIAYSVVGARAPDGMAVEPGPAVPPGLAWARVTDLAGLPQGDRSRPWQTQGSQVLDLGQAEEALENATGTTVQVRLKLLEGPVSGRDGAVLSIQDGAREGKLSFFADRLEVLDLNNLRATYFTDTTAGFYDYRLAQRGDTLRVYVNGAEVASAYLATPVSRKGLLFGDFSPEPGENFQAQIEYLVYTTQGAFAPEGEAIAPLPAAPAQVPQAAAAEATEAQAKAATEDVPSLAWQKVEDIDSPLASASPSLVATSGSETWNLGLAEEALDNATGTTVQVKLRLLEGPASGRDGAMLSIQDGAREGKLSFFVDRLEVSDQNQLRSTYLMDTTAGFYDYRLVQRGGILKVYVNGAEVASVLLAIPVSGKGLLFGDFSPEPGGNFQAEVEHLAYTPRGAFPP